MNAATTLWHDLAPSPGRLGNTVRLVVLVVLTVAISETFRLPEPAVSAYIVLFVSRAEPRSTVKTALGAAVALTVGIFVTIMILMVSLSEPALRLPLIAAATFVSVFFSRASKLGPAAFGAGFIIAFGLTLGDQVLGLSLQSGMVSNTTELGLPDLLFIPPEEALLRFLLWLTVVHCRSGRTRRDRQSAHRRQGGGRYRRPAKPKTGLVAPDAWSNPGYVHFALKVTLAVMVCYIGESLAAWPQIHTAIVTCFFVAQGTLEESVHKALLRLTGATIGGALGLGTIIVLMPSMTQLSDLLLAIAAVTFIAGWVAGAERIGYAGIQIGLAFYLSILQGYGPTLDMQTARDRVIGILIGNVVVLAIFKSVWPNSVPAPARLGHA